MSRPVLICPSVWSRTRPRRSFMTRVWCVSARPSSQGSPACLMELMGLAPGAAFEAADEDIVRVRLGNARRDGAHAAFGHELYADAGLRVGVFQVKDELCQVLDGIDVVVRRRRYKGNPRRRVPGLRDDLVDLVARELPAFARFRALGDLDLQFVGVGQVIAGDAEPS